MSGHEITPPVISGNSYQKLAASHANRRSHRHLSRRKHRGRSAATVLSSRRRGAILRRRSLVGSLPLRVGGYRDPLKGLRLWRLCRWLGLLVSARLAMYQS